MNSPSKPSLAVLAGRVLFESFFAAAQQRELSRLARWTRFPSRRATRELRRMLAGVEALITTWDSPAFGEDLLDWAPRLRIIAHCGGEVKARFARGLFDNLTITNAPDDIKEPS